MKTNMNAQIEIKHWAGRVLYTHQPVDSSEMTMRHALEAATVTGANLTGAYLTGANLTDAYLRDANLTGAYLTGANLTDAYLRDANLTGAYLTGANLTGAYLTGANLRGANLTGAYLTGANLTDAYLTGANLRGANLTGAYLTGATIYGVKITRAPVIIDGLRWGVTIINGHIKIGCQFHGIGAWSAFDDAAIAAMDGRDALRFWREHKAVIMALAAPFAAMPAGEAPA